MKDVAMIFFVILVLLTLVSLLGGSVHQREERYAEYVYDQILDLANSTHQHHPAPSSWTESFENDYSYQDLSAGDSNVLYDANADSGFDYDTQMEPAMEPAVEPVMPEPESMPTMNAIEGFQGDMYAAF